MSRAIHGRGVSYTVQLTLNGLVSADPLVVVLPSAFDPVFCFSASPLVAVPFPARAARLSSGANAQASALPLPFPRNSGKSLQLPATQTVWTRLTIDTLFFAGAAPYRVRRPSLAPLSDCWVSMSKSGSQRASNLQPIGMSGTNGTSAATPAVFGRSWILQPHSDQCYLAASSPAENPAPQTPR